MMIADLFYSQESPNDALRIFTEDITEVQSLPREQVLEHLQSCAPNLTIPYLVGRAHSELSRSGIYNKDVTQSAGLYREVDNGVIHPRGV